mmetsp:Transcript_32805/g.60037  ORF Transcript_32805/g.60037 Transcript_32805/m.60037 type:complete len:607 (-) Transcript_32805:53-1873(-)
MVFNFPRALVLAALLAVALLLCPAHSFQQNAKQQRASVALKSRLGGFTTLKYPHSQIRADSRLFEGLSSDQEPDHSTEDEEISKAYDSLAQAEFFNLVYKEKDFSQALAYLKDKGDRLDLTSDDFGAVSYLLTMLSEKVLKTGAESGIEDISANDEEASALYAALAARGALRGFGCVGPRGFAHDLREVAAADMQRLTDLPISALTPSGAYDNYWLGLGAALVAAEVAAGAALGFDALEDLVPLTGFAIILDRLLLGGAVVDTTLKAVVPGFKDKIAKHEAGHFLLAYLLGCPVQGCLLNPFQLRGFVAAGQGGTLFSDPTFRDEMARGTITQTSIDRFSVVLMAGIAAEALEFGSADGGQGDEAQLISLLAGSIQPRWGLDRIKGQARWAATQAVLLLGEHREAYLALARKIREDAPLGELVRAIEEHLPAGELPAAARARAALGLQLAEAGAEAGEKLLRERTGLLADPEAAAKEALARDLGEDLGALARGLQEKLNNPGEVKEQTDGPGGGVWLNDLKTVKEAQSAPPPPMRNVLEEQGYKILIERIEMEKADNAKKLEEIEQKLKDVELRMQQQRQQQQPSTPPPQTMSNSDSVNTSNEQGI